MQNGKAVTFYVDDSVLQCIDSAVAQERREKPRENINRSVFVNRVLWMYFADEDREESTDDINGMFREIINLLKSGSYVRSDDGDEDELSQKLDILEGLVGN